MNPINEFLKGFPWETRFLLYGRFGTCVHIVALLALFIFAMQARFSKKNVLKLFVSYYAAFFASTNACSIFGNLTDGLIPQTNLGVAYLFFLAVFSFLIFLLRGSLLQNLDIAAPTFILGRSIGIIGCLFTGCCHGFPAEWGIYSYSTGTTVVPTVLFDIFLSIAIVLYLILTKKKYSASGLVAAKSILLFGVLRYVIDVLRDNDKLF